MLLMSGAWGLGPIAAAAAALADAGVQVLAVAGRNVRLENRLRAAARQRPRLHVFGYTEEIPALMAAADLVITSSGDTCAEARTVGRSLLLLDVVQGHGRDNLQHELELGDADVASARPAEMVRCALAALDRVKPPSPGAARFAATWETAFTMALEDIGLGCAWSRTDGSTPSTGQRRFGACRVATGSRLGIAVHHDLVQVGALGVQDPQVAVQLGGGGGAGRALRAQDGGHVVLHPLRVRGKPR